MFPSHDRGAAAAEVTETYLTSQYIFHAENHLRMQGYDVCVLTDGWYTSRHRRVNDYCADINGKCVYVACHINAGNGHMQHHSMITGQHQVVHWHML